MRFYNKKKGFAQPPIRPRALARKAGFTLVEIVVVIAILSTLSTLAITSLLRTRLDANEALAISSLRTISTACEGYRAVSSPMGYSPDLATLGNIVPPYLNRPLATAIAPPGTRGYYYTYVLVSGDYYTCTATPVDPGVTGKRVFFIDASGVIKLDDVNGQPVNVY
ncbi:MAG: type II secretion system protein [Candidatus Omnitrophota bacterium]